MPELSFGFDTLTKYPYPGDATANTVDGICAQDYTVGSGVVWGTIIAAAGTYNGDADAAENMLYIESDSGSGNWRILSRAHFLFDTAALTSGAGISSAVFSFWGLASQKQDSFSPAIAPTVDIYGSTCASNTDLANSDYAQTGSTSYTGSPITYASFSVSAYNAFTFNATGIGNVSKTSITKLSGRNANYDVAATPPTWSASHSAFLGGYFADQTGTTNDPKLVVTYTIPESYITITKNWALE